TRAKHEALAPSLEPLVPPVRDFVRGFEPSVRFRPDGVVEIRFFVQGDAFGADQKVAALSLNDFPIAPRQLVTGPAPYVRNLPDARYVEISGSMASSEREPRPEGASSFVVKGQIADGPSFAALGEPGEPGSAR